MHRPPPPFILVTVAAAFLFSNAQAAPLKLAQSPTLDQEMASPSITSSLTGIAVSSNRLRSDEVIYLTGFNPRTWSGSLSAHRIHGATGEVNPTPSWSAHTLLDSPGLDVNARNILTHNGERGAAFRWNVLGSTQQKQLQGAGTAAEGQRLLQYLRGYQGDELGQTGGTLRHRDSRLGGIVNTTIWQTRRPDRLGFEHAGHEAFRRSQAERPAMLYAGANDGMLHAFDVTNGREVMAYVPRGAYENLWHYAQPEYHHRYFVDGQVFSGDADIGGNGTESSANSSGGWRTVLLGSLGGGGRGYFVLDVTQPLPESNPASTFQPSGVLLDRTFAGAGGAPDEASNDIGHLYAPPVTAISSNARSDQVVKLNNRRWAIVMGNGINSANERPVLLIQYLDGQRELQRLVARTATGQGNGLSAPRLLDVNGDGLADVAYAGDLHGNLWKFDLTRTDSMQWGVSTWADGADACRDSDACVPFYSAQADPSQANVQPITTAPMWMLHPLGGVQILFGTGRNVTEADRGDAGAQTIYSLWDRSAYKMSEGSTGQPMLIATNQQSIRQGRQALVRQSVTGAVRIHASGTETPTAYFYSSRHPVPYSRSDPNTPRGWYLDLPEPRERVLSNPQLFEGQKVIVSTIAPAKGLGEDASHIQPIPATGWVNVLNMITGQPASTPVFSTTDATMAMTGVSRVRLGTGELAGIHTRRGDLDLVSFKPVCVPADAPCTEAVRLNAGRDPGRRADWREIP